MREYGNLRNGKMYGLFMVWVGRELTVSTSRVQNHRRDGKTGAGYLVRFIDRLPLSLWFA